MTLSEQEIISAIKEGDENVFEHVFRKYYQTLCTYANSMLKEIEEAEEIVQNLFLSIWEKREDLEISISFKSYLYRAVHNHCLNRIKHLKVREDHQQYAVNYYEASYESVSQTVIKNELEFKIEEAIKKLPEQCQLIFRMSRFEELKYHEIAEQLNLSPKTVENQIGKALKILRLELAEYLPLLIFFLN
ncbi:RNA polymerase, sigma-24 subunit, ECF subfamily [Emticicia oligotrophica DSM 17448]|uniref:RNA polymerase, sigma-24 subunit, ECF subfamily n=1 Tax=Emticicia oligotrophica (strain DSM 17448 / CIP 109782 / MTCC 6937 / GPTSA100-15) TaxID=929562 RepID=A0ABN4APW4_EMTOG|nr:RNA polymerase sigma-70 factor [Emticicia oligotrophica]AFK04492.1 RNA polymerase, sigma-24 subunit, ECF subfamily [Emticicia oligotrophica DSM 17448]